MDYPKFLILCNGRPVGCLCVIPEFQGKGIGTQAIKFIKAFYSDWEEFTLITPDDKLENAINVHVLLTAIWIFHFLELEIKTVVGQS